jgi:hypothetical protein
VCSERNNSVEERSICVEVLSDGARVVVDHSTGEVLEVETTALIAGNRKASASKYYASALAEGLAGEPVSLGRDDAGQTILVGRDGRELLAEPGEGFELRAAALLLLEAKTPWSAVGTAEDGRVFGIGGAGYTPGLRYSPAYQRKQSSRSRKVAREALKLVRRRLAAMEYSKARCDGGKVLPVAWTLTSPTLDPSIVPGVSEAREEKRLLLAWSLLRKRDLFASRVFACFRGYEVTRKPFWDGTITFHPHFHLLAWAKYVDQRELAWVWWACLREATRREYGFDLGDLYPDPGKDGDGRTALDRAVTASVFVQAVRNKTKRGDGALSLEDAVQETMKYATKPDEIASYWPDPETGEPMVVGLPSEHLRAEVWRRSPRIFERCGAARESWDFPEWGTPAEGLSAETLAELTGEAVKAAAQAIREAVACSLDTPPISDGDGEGKKRETLRALMLTLDLHRWLQIASRRAFSALDHLEKGLRAKGYWVPALAGEPPG